MCRSCISAIKHTISDESLTQLGIKRRHQCALSFFVIGKEGRSKLGEQILFVLRANLL